MQWTLTHHYLRRVKKQAAGTVEPTTKPTEVPTVSIIVIAIMVAWS